MGIVCSKIDTDAGKLQPSKMITRKIALDDLVEDGIKALINDKENQVKIVVQLPETGRMGSAVH